MVVMMTWGNRFNIARWTCDARARIQSFELVTVSVQSIVPRIRCNGQDFPIDTKLLVNGSITISGQ